MPISYQFIDRKTEQPVSLPSVDEAICRFAGVKCDPERYSFAFNAIVWTGLAMLARSGRDPVDEAAFNEYMERNADDYDAKSLALWRKMLLEDYKFTGWHQHKS